jgi:hypothetical protein
MLTTVVLEISTDRKEKEDVDEVVAKYIDRTIGTTYG